MFELPYLASELIYKYLNYYDLLNLRSTCKNLKQYIDQKEFKRLHLFVQQNHRFQNLFYENELINYRDSLRIDDLQALSSPNFKKTFNQIQKLSIFNYPHCYEIMEDFNINLNDLNHFSQLEHLEIQSINKIKGRLSLKNLKVLSVIPNKECFFELECPNLIALRFYSIAKLKLISSQNNLTYLHYMKLMNEHRDYLLNLFSSLQNLSKICFDGCYGLNVVKELLNEINHNKINLCFLEQIEINGMPIKHENIENLLVLMRYPSKKPIKILFNGQLISLEKLTSILNHSNHFRRIFDTLDEEVIELLIENSPVYDFIFPQICDLSLRGQPKLNEKLNEKLMRKIKNLESIEIELDKRILQLICKTCPKLHRLFFSSSNLESHELNQLPEHLLYISHLSFYDGNKINNFYFIGKFKNLRTLTMGSFQLEKEVLSFIFNNCLDLFKILFYGKFRAIEIQKIVRKNFFKINCSSFCRDRFRRKEYEFDTLESLIDFYYANNLFESKFIYWNTSCCSIL